MKTATVYRKTLETDISATLELNGSGKADISTGIGFFDHMLTAFTRHGFFDLTLRCKGDLEVDTHHSIEDTGIVIGQAIKEAIGDKSGIKRFGYFILPMDDALCMCAVDLSGRPYLSFEGSFRDDLIGDMQTQMVREFFYAVSYAAGMNIHIRMLSGENDHHIAESMFKAFGKALDMAVSSEERLEGVMSTKGNLA